MIDRYNQDFTRELSDEAILKMSEYLHQSRNSNTGKIDLQIRKNEQMLKPREINKFSTKIFRKLGYESDTHLNKAMLTKILCLANRLNPEVANIDSDFKLNDLKSIIMQGMFQGKECFKNSLNSYLLARFGDRSVHHMTTPEKSKFDRLNQIDLVSDLRSGIQEDSQYEVVPGTVDPSQFLDQIDRRAKSGQLPQASSFSQFR
jgi:hypothetical protein